MRTYECYLLDTRGDIASAQAIECFDDGEACLRAGKILAEKVPNYSRVEVWEVHRRVGSIRTRLETVGRPSERMDRLA
jgi:hypothetical protein